MKPEPRKEFVIKPVKELVPAGTFSFDQCLLISQNLVVLFNEADVKSTVFEVKRSSVRELLTFPGKVSVLSTNGDFVQIDSSIYKWEDELVKIYTHQHDFKLASSLFLREYLLIGLSRHTKIDFLEQTNSLTFSHLKSSNLRGACGDFCLSKMIASPED